jgi:hypothetical protein
MEKAADNAEAAFTAWLVTGASLRVKLKVSSSVSLGDATR